ncbi:MAG: hypothetical protein LBH19_06285 [Dysgonamonadaceae bacterium]|jgi:hypothetical protein|nr:hypothetical protein [Dysgonamonadaceae bacterium]
MKSQQLKMKNMKMKSLIGSCIIALGTTFLWSCNNEETFIDKNNPSTEQGKLSFVLPLGAGSPVTYASVKGNANEYRIANLRIYWFITKGTDEVLYKRFAWGENVLVGGIDNPTPDPLQLTSANNSTLVTIDVEAYNEPSKFYIVANLNGDTTKMVKCDTLSYLRNGCLRADFEALLFDELKNADNLELLGAPIPMSIAGAAGAAGYIEVAHPAEEKNVVSGTLKRRVARFDIMNTADYSNFEIKKIIVTGAQRQGYLQDLAFDGTAPWTANTGRLSVTPAQYAGPTSYPFNGPAGSGIDHDHNGVMDEFDPGAPTPGDSLYLTESAFYLYPTLLKAGKTEISIEGVYNKTINRIYDVDLSKFANSELAIDANKVYRIRVIRDSEARLRMDLTVDDWDSVDTVPTVNKGNAITSWGVMKSSAQASVSFDINNGPTSFVHEFTTSEINPSIADTISFITAGTHLSDDHDPLKRHTTLLSILPKVGAVVGDDYLQSDFDIIKAAVQNAQSFTDLTYAGAEFTTEHKIALPPTTAPIEVRLQIVSAINSQDSRIINLRSNNYNKLGVKPVKVGSLLWAPVNVGATLAPDTTATLANDTKSQQYEGLFFEWGRSKPGFPTALPTGAVPKTTSTPYATVALAEADSAFVVGQQAWISGGYSQNLWGAVTATPAAMRGPCPEGWRLPTRAEIALLIARKAGSTPAGWRTFVGDDGAVCLPSAGFRNSDTSALSNAWGLRDGNGYYWAADSYDGSSTLKYLQTGMATGTSINANTNTSGNYGYGMTVRAVRVIH